jgi:uncharacterized protein YciW
MKDREMGELNRFERGLAEYVASTINGGAHRAAQSRESLVELGVPHWLLDSVRDAAGRWPVCDDDRIDVIVEYAARLTRSPRGIGEADVGPLRSVGLTDLDIVDLTEVVARVNAKRARPRPHGPRSRCNVRTPFRK